MYHFYSGLKNLERLQEELDELVSEHTVSEVDGEPVEPDFSTAEAVSLGAAMDTLKTIEIRWLRERADFLEGESNEENEEEGE